MSFRQKGQDGPSTGSGHQFPRPNEPFGPVHRSLKEVVAEHRAFDENAKQTRIACLPYLAGFPDLMKRVNDRTTSHQLCDLVSEAKVLEEKAKIAREKEAAEEHARQKAERDWFNS